MTEVAIVYGQALYDLAKSEDLSAAIWQELSALKQSICMEAPDFLKLLSSPSLTKQERCRILDDSFRGKLHPYVLNFMKILTEKGHIRHFGNCCDAYQQQYYLDNNILTVRATVAAMLSSDQQMRLTEKLATITGKQIDLQVSVDPYVVGGIRLDYDGKQIDDTLCARLDAIGKLLKNTVL